MKLIRATVLFIGLISSCIVSADAVDCGCLKDIVYGEREYSYNNSTGDGTSQSEVIHKLLNVGIYIQNQGSAIFGDGSQAEYFQVIQNSYASSFTYKDVLSCVGSNVYELEQMKIALKNINRMRVVAHGFPIFDVASTTLITTGMGDGVGGTWTEIGGFIIGLTISNYQSRESVDDIFAYLAISETDYCRKKFLKKFVLKGQVEKY